MEQFLTLTLHHSRHRYPRPAAHDLCDIIGCDLLTHKCVTALCGVELQLDVLDVVFQPFQFAVTDLGNLGVVALTLSFLSLKLQVLNGLLVLLNLVHQSFLCFPFSSVGVLFLLQLGNLLVELFDLILVTLTLDGLALNLKLFEFALNLIELFRLRVTLHPKFGGCLIHQVNGLVGEETVRDIPL